MKLTVLGATGPTGLLVVRQALALGHSVTAYARRRGDLPTHPQLQVVLGELGDAAAMEGAFRGADAVISCLGVPPKAKTGLDLMSRSMPSILQGMKSAGVARLIVLSAVGVGASRRKTSLLLKLAYPIVAGAIFDDKAKSESMLAASDRDWTLIYPPVLTDGPRTGRAQRLDLATMRKINGLAKVSRADVADALIEAAGISAWSRKTIVVTP